MNIAVLLPVVPLFLIGEWRLALATLSIGLTLNMLDERLSVLNASCLLLSPLKFEPFVWSYVSFTAGLVASLFFPSLRDRVIVAVLVSTLVFTALFITLGGVHVVGATFHGLWVAETYVWTRKVVSLPFSFTFKNIHVSAEPFVSVVI